MALRPTASIRRLALPRPVPELITIDGGACVGDLLQHATQEFTDFRRGGIQGRRVSGVVRNILDDRGGRPPRRRHREPDDNRTEQTEGQDQIRPLSGRCHLQLRLVGSRDCDQHACIASQRRHAGVAHGEQNRNGVPGQLRSCDEPSAFVGASLDLDPRCHLGIDGVDAPREGETIAIRVCCSTCIERDVFSGSGCSFPCSRDSHHWRMIWRSEEGLDAPVRACA